ncbi:MAG: 4-hydroxy-tetrahydrodipicolinate synthase [Thermoleophilaceae bacterium]|nr:4-hydroxy-tetrahydrodipicolinate synthase [Thermoleophilaceae bacterium]
MEQLHEPTAGIIADLAFGGILTAMVTPFDADGEIDEHAFVALLHHLLEEAGSDGLVVAGTTGEGSTMSDAEKCRLWELAVDEAGGAPVIAGTGSNDTKHSAELTQRADAIGVDGVLVVSPYYNRPNRRGIVAHYQAVAAATERPVVLYNIPQRSAIDMPNDLLAELAEIDNVVAVKQARYEQLEPVEGLSLLAGNDDMLPDVLDMGGTGGILVASHVAGHEMRRMIDEPDSRREIHDSLTGLYEALGVAPAACSVKGALEMLGHEAGVPRLPYVELTRHEAATVREALERHGLPASAKA